MALLANNKHNQNLGVVVVLYLLEQHQLDKDSAWKLSQMMRAMPLRVSAMHICYDSELFSPLLSAIKLELDAFTRIRLRTHFGKKIYITQMSSSRDDTFVLFMVSVENTGVSSHPYYYFYHYCYYYYSGEIYNLGSHGKCVASLQGYGIHPSFFPIKQDGKIEMKKLSRALLERQRQTERRHTNLKRRNRVVVPGRFDVLFGKGSPLQKHVGNMKLRKLISDCQKSYEKAEKGSKYEISLAVMYIVKESGGLFLKQPEGNNGSWVIVDDDAAQLKVTTLFRSHRAKQRKNKPQKMISLSPTNCNNYKHNHYEEHCEEKIVAI